MPTPLSHDFAGAQEFTLAVGRGDIPWAKPFSSYGKFTATGAVVNHVIWPDGVYNIPAPAGVQMSIVSTSAQDAVGGTGMITAEIHYLDANLAEQIETITMTGLTPKLTVATNIRFIQCVHIVTVGSSKSAVGNIIVSNAGITYSQIEAGSRRCASSVRMVPANKKLFVAGAVAGGISGTAAAGVQIKLSSTYFDGHDLTSQLVFMPFGNVAVQDTTVAFTFPVPAGPFPSGVLVGMECTTDKGAIITGDWFGWLENA